MPDRVRVPGDAAGQVSAERGQGVRERVPAAQFAGGAQQPGGAGGRRRVGAGVARAGEAARRALPAAAAHFGRQAAAARAHHLREHAHRVRRQAAPRRLLGELRGRHLRPNPLRPPRTRPRRRRTDGRTPQGQIRSETITFKNTFHLLFSEFNSIQMEGENGLADISKKIIGHSGLELTPKVKKKSKIPDLIFPNFDITFDLSKIEISNFDQNVHLDKIYNFDVGLKIQNHHER
jgi:hypothetical protein